MCPEGLGQLTAIGYAKWWNPEYLHLAEEQMNAQKRNTQDGYWYITGQVFPTRLIRLCTTRMFPTFRDIAKRMQRNTLPGRLIWGYDLAGKCRNENPGGGALAIVFATASIKDTKKTCRSEGQ